MPAGIGGGSYLIFCFESVMGTFVEPNDAGAIAMPFLDENLTHEEDVYISQSIRQQAMAYDAKPSYYHIEGDVTVEVDPRYFPYWMHCARHNIAKSGAGPYTYTYTPSSAGSASTAASGNVMRTCSLTIVKNAVAFGFFGCTVGGYTLAIEDGVLRVTLNILGMGEQAPTQAASPAWFAPNLYGADSHRIYIADSAVTPTFVQNTNYNGFSFEANSNAEAQNRIRADRAASYISYGEVEATFDTELDFLDRTQYDQFKAVDDRAMRLLSTHPGSATTVAASTDAVQLDINRFIYESYEVPIGGLGDLIMADVTGRALALAGGDAYSVTVKSTVNIA